VETYEREMETYELREIETRKNIRDIRDRRFETKESDNTVTAITLSNEVTIPSDICSEGTIFPV